MADGNLGSQERPRRVRVLKDIPELVKGLREVKARCKDYIVPLTKMEFVGEVGEAATEENPKPKPGGLFLRFEGGAHPIQEQVHPQFAQKFGVNGHYYSRVRGAGALDLLAYNLEYWRKKGNGDKRLVRLLGDEVRGFLSDRYRPLDSLDLVSTAVQVVTGKDGGDGEDKPWARGAKAFDWALSPTRLHIGLVNPGLLVDLNNLDKGVQVQTPEKKTKGKGGGTDFVYAGQQVQSDDPNQGGWFWSPEWDKSKNHMVFPAAFLRNSETGHGGLGVQVGLYEAVCDNTARIGEDFAQRHLGRQLDEEFWSDETLKKENALIFAKVADLIRSVFNPEYLLENAKKMKGLQKVEIEVRKAVNEIVQLPGMTEEIRDDILAAYQPLSAKRDTLLDLQRAVTAAAHYRRERDADGAILLEEFGGEIIEKGVGALKS